MNGNWGDIFQIFIKRININYQQKCIFDMVFNEALLSQEKANTFLKSYHCLHR